jgi:hypothetical protein
VSSNSYTSPPFTARAGIIFAEMHRRRHWVDVSVDGQMRAPGHRLDAPQGPLVMASGYDGGRNGVFGASHRHPAAGHVRRVV